MKRISLLISILLLATIVGFSQEKKVLGYWLTEKGTSQIKIFKATNGMYYGKIEWLKNDTDKRDIHNPDESLRDNRLLGMQILKGFKFNSDEKQWEEGTIYDPDTGKTYDCYMWFEDDPNVLKIKGYVLGMRFLGRETSWTREEGLRD
jgi:uncharacterized protein (DUF2147 family)